MNLNKALPFFNRVSTTDKSLLARQLATMLSAGLAIDQSFKILATQSRNSTLKTAYAGIIADLEQGQSLAQALSRHENVFDPVFIAIIRSGESTGKLDVVLDQLATRLELSQEFNSKIKAAMYYPIFVLLTMVVIIFLMMIYIIPSLQSVFTENNIVLPLSTRMIMAMSNFTVKFWWLEIIVIVALGIGFYFFFHSKNGGSLWDRMKIRIPILNNLFILIYMSRFCRTVSMLTTAGVPIIETIAITSDVIQNQVYSKKLKDVTAQVERGIPMSVPIQREPALFPPMVSEMILVGEQTGKMGQILNRLAEYYEKESDTTIKALSSLIEPALIVVIGAGVGFLVFSVIMPIYSIAQTGF